MEKAQQRLTEESDILTALDNRSLPSGFSRR
jgi:hypothetical protein